MAGRADKLWSANSDIGGPWVYGTRGTSHENRTLLYVLIYRCENGCKWRTLSERFGHWQTVHVRLDRWSHDGVLERVYAVLVAEGLTGDEVYPDAHGAQNGGSRGGDRKALRRLEHKATRAGGGPAGGTAGAGNRWAAERTAPLLMDRAYGDDQTRLTVWEYNRLVR